MRMRRTLHATLTITSVLVAVIMLVLYARAEAQLVTPRPEQLRFQLLVSEPVATDDGRGVVAGLSAMVVRDRTTGQCYVTLSLGTGMGISPTTCQK